LNTKQLTIKTVINDTNYDDNDTCHFPQNLFSHLEYPLPDFTAVCLIFEFYNRQLVAYSYSNPLGITGSNNI